MSNTHSDTTDLYSVGPYRGLSDGAWIGTCLHADCVDPETGRSAGYTGKKGSPDKARAAIRDHLRDKHGVVL